ncbi:MULTISPECIES: hypothetical protein [unclassified Photorhabdus]|uniref:hypothetical protein n=1 Tax=unclassified Photorhabdus TaxID=2620880 RepID=UPI001314081E|nr:MULTISPECIES: hypothetical protein [unclassified Photorhabdus]
MLKMTTNIALDNGYLYSCLNSLYRDVMYTRYLQVASLLAALTHPGHIVIYAPGIRSLAVALHLEIHWV